MTEVDQLTSESEGASLRVCVKLGLALHDLLRTCGHPYLAMSQWTNSEYKAAPVSEVASEDDITAASSLSQPRSIRRMLYRIVPSVPPPSNPATQQPNQTSLTLKHSIIYSLS